MKVAVLIAGEYREFETAFKSWKFKDWFDCDFYFSTWDRTYEFNEKLNINIDEPVSLQRIKKIVDVVRCNIYNSKMHDSVLSIKSQSAKSKAAIKSLSNEQLNFIKDAKFGFWKQIFLLKSCINLMTYSGIEYTHAILIRPDLFLNIDDASSKSKFIEKMNTKFIVLGGYTDTTTQDQMYFGPVDLVSRFNNVNVDYISYMIGTELLDCHKIMRQEFFRLFREDEIDQLFCDYIIVRSNAKNFDNYNDVLTAHKIWWRTKYNQEVE